MLLGLLGSALVGASTACAARTDVVVAAPSPSPTFRDPSPPARTSAHGVACYAYEHPRVLGPSSYAVADVGKSDVPKLNARQRRMLRGIRAAYGSHTLRFAFIPDYDGRDGFTVFDAPQGPCPSSGVRYGVLSEAPWSFYQPGENAFAVEPAMNDANRTPYPWAPLAAPRGRT